MKKRLFIILIIGLIFISGCVKYLPNPIKICQDGEQKWDECNRCTCSNNGWSCTEKACGTCSGTWMEGKCVSNNNSINVVLTVGQEVSHFLIQKINSDSVEGLSYQAYPVPTGEGTPEILHIGDNIGYACEGISEKLTDIDFFGQKVTFTKVVSEPPLGGCPICLSGNTLIDTPNGNINVKELKIGTQVWTFDKLGYRQPAIILKIGQTQVPQTHKMVHLILGDGKELFVSQGHPTADGKTFGDIKLGDIISSSYVKNVELVPYNQKYTYDILPSGDTGFYWANGILVGSTLHN